MTDEQDKKKEADEVKYWLGEVSAARGREKDWRKEGRRVLEIYGGGKKDEIPFNILYSNTETQLPALYNNTPRPVVQRRFKDEDPIGKASATAAQRMAEFLLDTNGDDYEHFDSVMGDSVLDALTPGRGATRVKYDADIQQVQGTPVVRWELVCFESIKWDRWIFGFAKKWRKVPWVALEHDVEKPEAEKLFGKAVADKMQFVASVSASDDDKEGKRDEKTDEDIKVAKVWEVWVKKDRTVKFVSPNYDEGFLKVDEDPLELSGFFPIPEPLRFTRKSNDQLPVSLYCYYENQAGELNRITTRINRVLEAIKVRGVYVGQLKEEIENLLKQDENTLTPIGDIGGLTDGGLEKNIYFMPIEKLVAVLQQLVAMRQEAKRVIYEITGISDILRGQTVASETLGAQKIKEEWATLRLKRIQRGVQHYARDLIRIAIEIAAKKFSERTWAAMTGLPFATQQQLQAANGQLAAHRSMAAMQGIIPPPPPPPEVIAVLQQPPWEKVLETLRTDTQRQYRIDIETNSTIDIEATEDQKNIADVLNAVSQILHGLGPLVENGTMPFEGAQALLLGIVRRYRFGPEIEDQIKMMKQPQPKPDPKAEIDLQVAQMEMQAKQQEMERQAQLDAQEHQFKMEEMREKRELAKLQAQVAIMKANNQIEVIRAQTIAKTVPQAKEPANASA